jgi:hypothetical protein
MYDVELETREAASIERLLMDIKVWGRMSWVFMQHHIKAVINPDAFNTKTQG